MYPELFGVKELPTFIIMISIGLIVMLLYVAHKFDIYYKNKKETDKTLLILMASLAFTLLFAYLFDAIFHYMKTGVFRFKGITFIGGLLGGIAAFILLIYIFKKNERKDILKLLTIITPGVVIAHSLGRIGCFLGGCCYGKVTTSFLGVYFPGNYEKVYPTQLFESIFLLVLFFVLVKLKKNVISIYLISYGVFRFLIEFLRGDDRGTILPNVTYPTPSQLLSLFLIAGGIILLLKYKEEIPIYKNKKISE